MYPPSVSTGDQILDTHPSLRVKQQGLVQRQPCCLRPAPNYQMTGSGNSRRKTTLAERIIKTIISREGWAASLNAAVITSGDTTRAGVNSSRGRIARRASSWPTSRTRPRRARSGPRQPPGAGPASPPLRPLPRRAPGPPQAWPRRGAFPAVGGRAHTGEELSEVHAVLGV